METIRIDIQGALLRVTLNRPDVRNAFNEILIAELTQALRSVPASCRAVVLTGSGSAFCAGADVDWMRKSRGYTEAENARDARAMADLFQVLDECRCPVVARVNGPAIAGGSGLVAACDIAVAVESATFGFTEVRLGILPAVISTVVLPKIGIQAARRYFLTGERFDAIEAKRLGLIHEVVTPESLDAAVEGVIQALLQCGPRAVEEAKKLLRDVLSAPRKEAIEHTIRTISRVRITPEAQEGLGAFLEKRKPDWAP